MTVAELIDELEKMPEDAEAVLWGIDDGHGGTIERVELNSKNGKQYVELAGVSFE